MNTFQHIVRRRPRSLRLATLLAFALSQHGEYDRAMQAAGIAPSIKDGVATAREVLDSGAQAEATRTKQHFWTSRGISGVPAMIFAEKYLTTGAQGVDGYRRMLERCRAEAA